MRESYRIVNEAQILANQWPMGQDTDTVTISIFDLTDDALDVNDVSMTNEVGGLFSYSWTPTQNNCYEITYFNKTLNVKDYEIVYVNNNSNVRFFSGIGV